MEKIFGDPESQGNPHANPIVEERASKSQKRKHYSFYMSIMMLCIIALIVSWDATALSLALPIIAQQLHATNFQSFWASIAFILGIAVTQPIYASVSDVVGRKYALYVSIILFGIGCIIFATATDMNAVVAGRLVKGLGGGGLDVLQTIILCDITTMKERPRWLGVLSVANAVAAVTGPFIGAIFAQTIGWTWLGWINLIAVGIAGALTFSFLRLTPIEGDIKDKMRKLDWHGFALFTIIGTTVALPLSWADALYPWASWQTLVPLLIGLLLIIPFCFVEKRAAAPMIPYQLFDNVSIFTGTVAGFLYGVLLNSIILYLPLLFQAVYHQTPLEAAKSTLPICSLIVGMSIIVSVCIEWSRKYRIAMWVGWVLTAIFLGLHMTVGANTSKAVSYTFQALLGAGLGTVLVSTQISVLASVTNVDNDGLAAGMLVTVRFVGSLLGLTMCATIFTSVFRQRLSSVKDLPEQLAILKDASKAVEFIPRLREIEDVPDGVIRSVIRAYEGAFQTIWVGLAGFAGFGALLSVLTRERSLEKDELGRQGFSAPSPESHQNTQKAAQSG